MNISLNNINSYGHKGHKPWSVFLPKHHHQTSNFGRRDPSIGELAGVMSTVFKRIPIGGSAAVFKVGVLPSKIPR